MWHIATLVVNCSRSNIGPLILILLFIIHGRQVYLRIKNLVKWTVLYVFRPPTSRHVCSQSWELTGRPPASKEALVSRISFSKPSPGRVCACTIYYPKEELILAIRTTWFQLDYHDLAHHLVILLRIPRWNPRLRSVLRRQ
jgi:hypothetical protein